MTKRKEVEEYVEPEPRSETYVVSGPHGVHETAPGEEIVLDPDKPETQRLLERGQITVPLPTEGAPVTAASESKE